MVNHFMSVNGTYLRTDLKNYNFTKAAFYH